MCMQCMAAAMSAGATAAGTRSFIAARHFSWVTPRRMRAISAGLLAGALIASSLLVSGSTPASSQAGGRTPAQLAAAKK
ncbi:MAG: hypothetical protein E6G56_08325 [Actinobacteria bacterium]|nr:MAG: hypothetical protein E6G56_08325 [Actinomycetota bacterium]